MSVESASASSVDPSVDELAPFEQPDTAGRPRVIVVGAGFGGLMVARTLGGEPVEVLVIDRRNHHLFQPLLYQVATAGLSPADIATPIRSILSRQANALCLLGEVADVDDRQHQIQVDTETGRRTLYYDWLVLATGASHAYFGHDEWAAFAPGLKTIDDATAIRRRLLRAFERAEWTDDVEARRPLQTVVVVGGGPTGVEMAGSIAFLTQDTLRHDFRRIDPTRSRVVLIEAGPRILSSFPVHLSAKAERQLRRVGVEVRVGEAVTQCDEHGVVVGGERIEARTVIWAAGVQASPVADWLKLPPEDIDRARRVKVTSDFSVPGRPHVFVIGDAATVTDAAGVEVPGVAPGAKQAGIHVGRLIASRVCGRAEPPPFRYRNWGNLATIGKNAAVADLGWLEMHGPPAWYFWGLVHVAYLVDFRSRLTVMVNWIWTLVTSRTGARLITGSDAPRSR